MKLYSQIQKLKSDARTFFIKYWYEEDFYDYMDDPDVYWIGDGHVLGCGDIFVSLEDIETIVKNNIPRDIFYDWYWYNVENEDINLVNYNAHRTYWKTHEEIVQWLQDEEKRRETPEYKEETERMLKKLYDEWIERLKKDIDSFDWEI